MPQNVNTTHPPRFTINRIYLTSTSISFYYSQTYTYTHTRACLPLRALFDSILIDLYSNEPFYDQESEKINF